VSEPAGAFLEASAAVESARAVLLGLPYDGGVSYRGGARLAPTAVRRASASIESYSPRLGRDLADLALADAGDLDLAGLPAERAMRRVADAVAGHAAAGRLVVALGGDHSLSIGTAEGLRRARQGLAHVVFDAHLDLRASYEGSALSHACGTRHLAAGGPTVVLGVRSGSREEFADASRLLLAWSEGLELPAAARRALSGRPVHVSLDLDVLDPSILPGTGNPEPGGPSYRALREALVALADLEVVAVDVCELSPPLDPSGVSAVVAAELVREMLLVFAP
jgi:agmatinase